MLRMPRGVFVLRPCTGVLMMESKLECSSSTETSTDSGTLSAASTSSSSLFLVPCQCFKFCNNFNK